MATKAGRFLPGVPGAEVQPGISGGVVIPLQ